MGNTYRYNEDEDRSRNKSFRKNKKVLRQKKRKDEPEYRSEKSSFNDGKITKPTYDYDTRENY